MKKRPVILALVLFAARCPAQDAAASMVALADLPAALQKGIQSHLTGLTLVNIDRVPDGKDMDYDINVTKDGQPRTFTVDATGALVSAQVLVSETPSAVQKTIQTQLGANTLDRIEKSFEPDDITYDVLMNTKDGQSLDFSVGPDGKLQQKQVLPAQVPAAALKTMQAQAAAGKLGDIDELFGENGATYASEVAYAGGQTRAFSVLPDGQLDSVQYFLPETSPAVQRGIKAEAGADELDQIVRNYSGSDFTYDVQTIGKDGESRSFSLQPDGTLKSREVFLAETPAPVQKAIQGLIQQAKLDEIEQLSMDGGVIYNVTVIRNGASRDSSITADGKIQSMEIGLQDAPSGVQKAINAQVADGKLDNIEMEYDDTGTTCEVDMTGKDGRTRYFILGEDGKLQTLQVYLDEVPAPVQATIQSRLQQGRVDNIEKDIDEDGTTYDVDIAARNGNIRSLVIDEDGKIE